MAALPVVFMYSGQGSQYYQMGKTLFDQDEIFQRELLELDRYFNALTGNSIVEEIYAPAHTKDLPFTKTMLTFPAVFMLEYALTQLLMKFIRPDYVLGASMGEFAASVTASSLTNRQALSLVSKLGIYLQEKCEAAGLLAILSRPSLYDEAFIQQVSELAAVNFDQHFVVAGTIPHLESISLELKKREIVHQLLPVERGYHSDLIDPAKADFLQDLQKIELAKPALPYYSCADAQQITAFSSEHLWNVNRKLIQFQKTITEMEKKGSYIYLDLGPSGTLATFVKYQLPATSSSLVFPTLTPYGQDKKNIEAVRDALVR